MPTKYGLGFYHNDSYLTYVSLIINDLWGSQELS